MLPLYFELVLRALENAATMLVKGSIVTPTLQATYGIYVQVETVLRTVGRYTVRSTSTVLVLVLYGMQFKLVWVLRPPHDPHDPHTSDLRNGTFPSRKTFHSICTRPVSILIFSVYLYQNFFHIKFFSLFVPDFFSY